MKKRNPILVLILSLITLNFYGLYWLITTRKFLKDRTQVKMSSNFWIIVPIIINALYYISRLLTLASTSNQSNSSAAASLAKAPNPQAAAMAALIILVIMLIIVIFFAVMEIIWYIRYAKAANQYTQGRINTGITAASLFIIGPIANAILQSQYNNFIDSGSSGGLGQPVPVNQPQANVYNQALGNTENSQQTTAPGNMPSNDSPLPPAQV